MALSPGDRLGPYEIVAPLGAGGMGEVYRAKDTRLGRDVAVKVLPQHLSSNAEIRARFEREAKTVSSLNHPHICTLHDVGREGNTDYLVMELIEGETLAQRLARGALPLPDVLRIAAQIADALDRAHRAGVTHRDLKPGNVMLTRSGAKLMDFGLARGTGLGPVSDMTSSPTVAGPLTTEGTIIGTFQYMAPEQLEGQPADARADLWALGCVLYEMATGRRAFEGKSQASLITAIMGSQPPPVSQVTPLAPPALDRLVAACLTKDPSERIQSAHDAKLQLGWMAEGGTATSSAASASRGRKGWIVPAGLAAALLLGAVAGYLGRGKPVSAAGSAANIDYQQITFEEGFIYSARFAPDGRTIVYSADWDGKPRDVFVTSLDSAEFRPLGFPGADLLAVSRTGELAILSGSIIPSGNPYARRGTLARASMTGGSPRPETDRTRYADIAGDGKTALIRDDGRRVSVEYPAGTVIAEMPIVRNAGYGTPGFYNPRLSPSGKHIAFFERRPGEQVAVRICDAGGKSVASISPYTDWWGLAWSRDDELWYAATEAAGLKVNVYALDLKGRRRVLYRAPTGLTVHDVSPQGDLLASFDRPWTRIEVLDGSGTTPRDRSWRESGEMAGFAHNHAVLISQEGNSGGPKGSVYALAPGASEAVRISDGFGMAISPDGSKALVSSGDVPPKVSIVPIGAGQPQPLGLPDVELIEWGGWHPDGRLVLQVIRSGGKSALLSLPPGGGAPAALLPEGLSARGDNLFSQNGSRMIATDDDGRLMICALDSSTCRPLPGASAGDDLAGWNAEGTAVFVYRKQVVPAAVERIDVETGARTTWKTVTPLFPAVSGLTRLVVSPDGAVAYDYNRIRTEMYAIKGLK